MDPSNPKPGIGDAFGKALLVALDGERFEVIYERDDGLVNADTGDYFRPLDEWDDLDRWCVDQARGRVLDIGAGAGRASLELEGRGSEVVALDVSPGALEVCRRRGVRKTFLGEVMDLARDESQKFDTFLALGNNIGLLGNPERAEDVLEAMSALANPGATIVGTCGDPVTGNAPPRHAVYHERNRRAGRMPGQIKLRTRFRNLSTPWFDLLLMSPEDLDALARKSGWKVAEIKKGQLYGAILMQLE